MAGVSSLVTSSLSSRNSSGLVRDPTRAAAAFPPDLTRAAHAASYADVWKVPDSSCDHREEPIARLSTAHGSSMGFEALWRYDEEMEAVSAERVDPML
jgi:hypothetical protein